MKAWTDSELAYLAGIIDGEGCLSLNRSARNRFTTQLYIGSTDPRLVHWLYPRFGGTVALRPSPLPLRHKPLWRWLIGGADLEALLTATLPYLVIKREQANLILEFRATLALTGPGHQSQPTPTPVVDHRILLKSKLLQLNKRGVA